MPANRLSGAIDWTAIKYNFRGEWTTGGIYGKNDVVRYNGRTYYCITDDLFDQGIGGPEYGPLKVFFPDNGHIPGLTGSVTWNITSDLGNDYLYPLASNSNNGITGTATGNFNTAIVNKGDLLNKRSGLTLSSAGVRYGFQKRNLTTLAASYTGAWDTQTYSTESYAYSAIATGQACQKNGYIMFGLNTDPTTNTSYASIDFAWFFVADGTLQIYENGSLVGSFGTYSLQDILSVTYDGKYVRYWKNSVMYRQVDRAPNPLLPLYYDSSFYTPNCAMVNMQFGTGVVNQYWAEHTEGYLFRGGWMAYRNYYPGDVVKLRGDVYLCKQYNFNGHPIYKNGHIPYLNTENPNPDWRKIASGIGYMNSDQYVEMLPNMPPLGWTKYKASWAQPGVQHATSRSRWFTASGKAYIMGDAGTNLSNGSGMSSANGGYLAMHPGGTLNFSHWDYRYGRLTGFQGQPPKCIQLVGNQYWGMALFDNGELYHWGYGGNGNTGDGQSTDREYPHRVGFIWGTHQYQGVGTAAGRLATTRIVKICTQYSRTDDNTHHCLVLDSDGNLWSWGYNGYGQLGHGDTANRTVPVKIGDNTTSYADTTVRGPVTGNFFDGVPIADAWTNGGTNYHSSYAIDVNGNLYSWGYNGYGQLGLGNTRNEPSPRRVTYDFNLFGGIKKVAFHAYAQYGACMILTNDGTIHGCGRMSSSSSAGLGTTQQGQTIVFRPYADMVGGNILPVSLTGYDRSYIVNALNNCDDFWIAGMYAGDNWTMIFKEKNTGELFGFGYNPNNVLMQLPSTTLENNSDANYNRQYYPIPLALSAPDMVFLGMNLQEGGSKNLYFITEQGKVYSSGGNDSGSCGWGVANNGVSNVLGYAPQGEWGITSIRTDSNKTWHGMRQHSRVAIIGGYDNNSSGSAYIVTEGHELQHIGYQNEFGAAGYVRYGEQDNPPDGGYGSYYRGRTGLPPNYAPVRVLY
jgi:alpha-tubulin suppressor-like RCC1 family protein